MTFWNEDIDRDTEGGRLKTPRNWPCDDSRTSHSYATSRQWPRIHANSMSGAIALPGFAEPGGTSGFDQPPSGDADDTASEAPSGSVRTITRAEAYAVLVGSPLAEIERGIIEATILHYGSSVPRAARVLRVSASTLYRKRSAWPTSPTPND